jgi:hypothetical protein
MKGRTFGHHALLQPIPFDKKLLIAFLAFRVILVLDIDHSTLDGPNAFDHNVWQTPLQLSQPIVLVLTVNINPQTISPRDNGDGLQQA